MFNNRGSPSFVTLMFSYRKNIGLRPTYSNIYICVYIYIDISEVKIAQSCLTLCNPVDYTVHGILQARILDWVAFLFTRGSSQPRDRTQVSCIAGGFFTSWATREAQEYCSILCSLSLLQRIFPTQISNWGLLHCRQILYQLSYQGNSGFCWYLDFFFFCCERLWIIGQILKDGEIAMWRLSTAVVLVRELWALEGVTMRPWPVGMSVVSSMTEDRGPCLLSN